MEYVYGDLLVDKNEIKKVLCGEEKKYFPIWEHPHWSSIRHKILRTSRLLTLMKIDLLP